MQRPMITIAQLNAIADAVGDRWRCLVEMAAWCGLRFGELAALRKDRIDIRSGTVSVVESAAVLAGGVRYVGPPKSDAGRREVAIPPHILPTVINHLERFSEPAPDGLVFVGPRGGVLSSANFGADVWRPAVASVGLKGFTFHGLRGALKPRKGCAPDAAALGWQLHGRTAGSDWPLGIHHETPRSAVDFKTQANLRSTMAD